VTEDVTPAQRALIRAMARKALSVHPDSKALTIDLTDMTVSFPDLERMNEVLAENGRPPLDPSAPGAVAVIVWTGERTLTGLFFQLTTQHRGAA
jgi:hypothetical protein